MSPQTMYDLQALELCLSPNNNVYGNYLRHMQHLHVLSRPENKEYPVTENLIKSTNHLWKINPKCLSKLIF